MPTFILGEFIDLLKKNVLFFVFPLEKNSDIQ